MGLGKPSRYVRELYSWFFRVLCQLAFTEVPLPARVMRAIWLQTSKTSFRVPPSWLSAGRRCSVWPISLCKHHVHCLVTQNRASSRLIWFDRREAFRRIRFVTISLINRRSDTVPFNVVARTDGAGMGVKIFGQNVGKVVCLLLH